jgi:YggT family protein
MAIILGNILIAIGHILNSLLQMMLFLIIARVIVSWVNADPSNFLVRIIVQTTDVVLKPFKRFHLTAGGLDFTPIIVLFLIYFFQIAVCNTLIEYGSIIKHPQLTDFTTSQV